MSLCERVAPRTPDGSRVSRIKVILLSDFSKSLIREGRVCPMNASSDLAVKMNVWDEIANFSTGVLA